MSQTGIIYCILLINCIVMYSMQLINDEYALCCFFILIFFYIFKNIKKEIINNNYYYIYIIRSLFSINEIIIEELMMQKEEQWYKFYCSLGEWWKRKYYNIFFFILKICLPVKNVNIFSICFLIKNVINIYLLHFLEYIKKIYFFNTLNLSEFVTNIKGNNQYNLIHEIEILCEHIDEKSSQAVNYNLDDVVVFCTYLEDKLFIETNEWIDRPIEKIDEFIFEKEDEFIFEKEDEFILEDEDEYSKEISLLIFFKNYNYEGYEYILNSYKQIDISRC